MTPNRKRLARPPGIQLPEPPIGWFHISYAVTIDGCLACFQATYDANVAWRDRRDASVPAGARGALFVFDGATVGERAEFDLEFNFPKFDRLPDGCWILASARCPVGEPYGRVIEADGAEIRQLCLGDGIDHLRADSQGAIWVGYFDEGVFGNDGWGAGEAPEFVRHSGLVRFDCDGRRVWSHDDAAQGAANIADCYALNVAEDAWACTYVDFPVLRVNRMGERAWPNSVAGAKAIAVDGSEVVLFGGYRARDGFKDGPAHREDRDRLALLLLGEAEASLVAELDLDFGGVGDAAAALIGGRGDGLHFVADGMWFHLSVAAIFDTIEFTQA